MTKRLNWLFSLLLIGVLGCSDSPRPKNVLEVSEPKEELRLKFHRLDKDLFSQNKDIAGLQAWHANMLGSDTLFYRLYLQNILQILPDSQVVFSLYRFVGDRLWKELQAEVEKAYPNTHAQDSALNQAFGKIVGWFPGKRVPEVYYFNSGFNVGIWPDSNLVGIGLEWYLGKENKMVKSLPPDFPQYQRDNMDRKYLPGDAVKGWLLVNCYQPKVAGNLLEYMVYYGKVYYLTEAALAPIADSVLFSYSAKQMDWCYKQEEHIWKELVKNDLVYSTADKELRRFTTDGPFTPGLPQDGAPMAGIYLGWKMVAGYMAKNPDTKPADLMNKVSATEILKAYKPRK